MPIESALVTLLNNNAGVSALISTRLYPNAIPQNIALPAVAYQVIATERNYNQFRQSNVASPRVQITVEAASYASAKSVAAAIRAALSGFNGSVGTTNPVVIGGIFLDSEYDGYNLDTDINTVRQDYTIEWREV